MTQTESNLHDADVPASSADTANEKTDAVITGDVEALGEEARAIDAQLHARVLRKIDWVLMPFMVIGTLCLLLYCDYVLIYLQVMDWFTGIRSVAN